MKKAIVITISILVTLVSLTFIFAEGETTTKTTTEKTAEGNWKWITLDDFEECFNWDVVNCWFSKKEWTKNNPVLSRMKGAPKSIASENNKYCLGAKFSMLQTGDTRRFVIARHKIQLPSPCKKVSFWINGRKKYIVVAVVFQDENNILYTLTPKPAILDFYGWQKLEIDNIDKKITQIGASPHTKYQPLRILGIVFSNPFEKLFKDKIYVYIDRFEALCLDDKPASYDGDNIPDTW